MIIREATLADCEACMEMALTPELHGPTGPTDIEWLRSFVREKQVFIVADDNGVVGFIMGEAATGRVGFLHMMAVRKEYQRKGVGQQLLRAAEESLRSKGVVYILIYAYGRNKASDFFVKNGYDKGSPVHELGKLLAGKEHGGIYG